MDFALSQKELNVGLPQQGKELRAQRWQGPGRAGEGSDSIPHPGGLENRDHGGNMVEKSLRRASRCPQGRMRPGRRGARGQGTESSLPRGHPSRG